jgi:hypothetical protein
VDEVAWVPVDQLLRGLVERPREHAPWLAMVTSLVVRELCPSPSAAHVEGRGWR